MAKIRVHGLGVTVMSIIGISLLQASLTSRPGVEGAALSSIHPNLFVNFSAPHQRTIKVSVKLASETGMVPQARHSLALLHNYNGGELKLNSPEDSAAEVTDSISIDDAPMPSFLKGNKYPDTIQIEYNDAGRQHDSNEEDPESSFNSSEETPDFWIPSTGKSGEGQDNFTAGDINHLPNNFSVPDNHSHSFYSDSTSDSENISGAEDEHDHSRYFVKVKTRPRDAFVGLGLGFSSNPIPQSIEPQFLITASQTPLPLSFTLNQNSDPFSIENSREDNSATVPNYINVNSKNPPLEKVFLPATSTPEVDLIPGVTQNYGTTDSTSIPGMAGVDYPILGEVPATGFDCQKQRYKGFFADLDTKCQAWHYCDFTDGHSTFLCPNGTLFSQVLLTCDWWFNVDCRQAQQLYVLNERLYRYIKAPKPSFPEDFHGPQVDNWLLEQLNLGLLPKMRKAVKDKVVIQDSN